MAHSGDVIDAKAFEADFFLEHLRNAGFDLFAAQCYVSAFVTASRSITFAMQACMNGVPGFEAWYRLMQEKLRTDPLARFFATVRNESQKIGHTPLTGAHSVTNPDGTHGASYLFVGAYEGDVAEVPATDAVAACCDYLHMLLGFVYECYEMFPDLSPLTYYSLAAMQARGETVEDMEQALGFPRGWTSEPEKLHDKRYHYLLRRFPDTRIDELFEKYLGKRRTILETLAEA